MFIKYLLLIHANLYKFVANFAWSHMAPKRSHAVHAHVIPNLKK